MQSRRQKQQPFKNAHFAKSTFCGVETKNMFVHTRSSPLKRFAKFGLQARTFCHKKVGKAIAKLESDRL